MKELFDRFGNRYKRANWLDKVLLYLKLRKKFIIKVDYFGEETIYVQK